MDEFTETGLTDLSFLWPLDALGFMKDECEGTGSSLLYPMVPMCC